MPLRQDVPRQDLLVVPRQQELLEERQDPRQLEPLVPNRLLHDQIMHRHQDQQHRHLPVQPRQQNHLSRYWAPHSDHRPNWKQNHHGRTLDRSLKRQRNSQLFYHVDAVTGANNNHRRQKTSPTLARELKWVGG